MRQYFNQRRQTMVFNIYERCGSFILQEGGRRLTYTKQGDAIDAAVRIAQACKVAYVIEYCRP